MAIDNSPEHNLNTSDNSSPILGTSSDAIIEGLHNGEFTESGGSFSMADTGDKDQIVNQQDQNEIVNPGDITEDETGSQGSEAAYPLTMENDNKDLMQKEKEISKESEESITPAPSGTSATDK